MGFDYIAYINLQEDEVNGVHVVVFADESDPEGFEFLQMMKEIAQTRVENEDLSIVWIDPDEFALVFFVLRSENR